jgi:hypothetical protein
MIKKTIKDLDKIIFKGMLFYAFDVLRAKTHKILKRYQYKSLLKDLERPELFKILLAYPKNSFCALSSLCDQYGSDKGELRTTHHPYTWPSHTYADLYALLFDHCRDSVRNVFECGLGTNNPELISSMGKEGRPGASLRVWRDYFPKAQIYGADIDKNILFEEDRIKTFFVDQTNPETIRTLWQKIGSHEFDLMIDDGLHTFEAGLCLFENSAHKLASNGLYVIEDVTLTDMHRYKRHFEKQQNFVVRYAVLSRNDCHLNDNNMILIKKAVSYGS